MVLRTSEPENAQPFQVGQSQQHQLGNASPDVNKFLRGRGAGESTADRILASLIPAAGQLAEKAFKVGLEEEYLKGVAAVGQVRSEEELDTNPITADWQKAGYRDTVGRLAIAQQQAQLGTDLPKLAQGTAEDFAEYRSQQRAKLMPQLEGMSQRQRSATFGQLALDEAGDFQKYTVAHAKYVLEQQEAAITAEMTVRRNSLDGAKGNAELYMQEVGAFTSTLYKSVFQNDNLPAEMKADLMRQAGEYAASSDNVAVYQDMKNRSYKFPDGSTGTLMSRLGMPEQIKLDTAHRKAMANTKLERAAGWDQYQAKALSDLDNPEIGPTETYAEIVANHAKAVDAGVASPGQLKTHLQKFYAATGRQANDNLTMQQYAVGDVGGLQKRGITPSDAGAAWKKGRVSAGATYEQIAGEQLAIGVTTGDPTAIKGAGESISNAVSRVGFGTTIDPAQAKVVADHMDRLDALEKSNPGAYELHLQGMSDGARGMFLRMRDARNNGGVTDPLQVAERARASQLADSKQGDILPAARRAAVAADVKAVNAIDDQTLLTALGQNVRSFFGSSSAATQKTLAQRGWFENDKRRSMVVAQSKVVFAEALESRRKLYPNESDSTRYSEALVAVGKRAIPLSNGVIYMPPGATVQGYFKVDQHADASYVGLAIDQLVVPREGNKMAWEVVANGRMLYKEIDPDGNEIPNRGGYLEPTQVKSKVEELTRVGAERASDEVGAGITRSKGMSRVTFNGENTAGFTPGAMLSLRNRIIDEEGITNAAYRDGKGTSAGVAVNTSNTFTEKPLGAGGIYLQDQVDRMFFGASNEAAEFAEKSMKSIGVAGDEYMLFFGDLAYQRPVDARDPELLSHIKVGDYEGAAARLRELPTYEAAPERGARRLATLKQAMRK